VAVVHVAAIVAVSHVAAVVAVNVVVLFFVQRRVIADAGLTSNDNFT